MGTVVEYVKEQRPRLTMQLIDALDARVAEHDNLCFINATLVMFMVARHSDPQRRLDGFLDQLLRVPWCGYSANPFTISYGLFPYNP